MSKTSGQQKRKWKKKKWAICCHTEIECDHIRCGGGTRSRFERLYSTHDTSKIVCAEMIVERKSIVNFCERFQWKFRISRESSCRVWSEWRKRNSRSHHFSTETTAFAQVVRRNTCPFGVKENETRNWSLHRRAAQLNMRNSSICLFEITSQLLCTYASIERRRTSAK